MRSLPLDRFGSCIEIMFTPARFIQTSQRSAEALTSTFYDSEDTRPNEANFLLILRSSYNSIIVL